MPDIVEKLQQKVKELEHKLHVAAIDLKDSKERVERRNDEISALHDWGHDIQRKIENIKKKGLELMAHKDRERRREESMISKLIIKNPSRAVIPWFGDVEAFQGLTEIEFRPGLNLLWGKNGAGKSTVIGVIAHIMHCEQGGYSCVTLDSLGKLVTPFGLSLDGEVQLNGVVLEHDGSPLLYAEPERQFGVVRGRDGLFDNDFFKEGLKSMNFKGSHGQKSAFRINDALKSILDQKPWPKEIEYKVKRIVRRETEMPDGTTRVTENPISDQWRSRLELAERMLAPTIEKGQQTVLFDEPDRSLDIPLQERLWGMLVKAAEKYQIIIASHSPVAVNLPNANYVQLSPEYLDESREVLKRVMTGL